MLYNFTINSRGAIFYPACYLSYFTVHPHLDLMRLTFLNHKTAVSYKSSEPYIDHLRKLDPKVKLVFLKPFSLFHFISNYCPQCLAFQKDCICSVY